ncbi:siroheme decarboxylase subunit beta [Halococcoides cellulosivorans]|uniref:siroheme decarboxylase n=1 Tax=Halococcoides cellulosivorans TaxID=1679096 RepID=A0A2R4X018_9EURY|nr:Lrp/AsnC family transcriptional regulator [Halococcoides cellulosivorans]AWB27146.1 Lrp/AsnC family transcriptional regulator [Halococcoides cellulosivorans]
MTDWRDAIDGLQTDLLASYRRGVPIAGRPYERMASALDATPDAVRSALTDLQRAGVIRRIGPAIATRHVGASTLAALAVPDQAVDRVGRQVAARDPITHAYRRDHRYSLWIVLTAGDRAALDAHLAGVATQTGIEPLDLPADAVYAHDLAFPVLDREPLPATRDRPPATPNRSIDPADRRLLAALQDGLPIAPRPYERVADRLDRDRDAVVETLGALQTAGFVRRTGLVVSHHATGYDATAMVAWAVPDSDLDRAGRAAAQVDGVTKVYARPARPERDWPYSLFTMIHARTPAARDRAIDRLEDAIGHAFERLETVTRYGQSGARL